MGSQNPGEQKIKPSALPPVVSVKKSSRGCAVVILRDDAIIERCALQRVAVIDGVCVEMKRHTKRSRVAQEGEDEPSGIFCAWGMKILSWHWIPRRCPDHGNLLSSRTFSCSWGWCQSFDYTTLDASCVCREFTARSDLQCQLQTYGDRNV